MSEKIKPAEFTNFQGFKHGDHVMMPDGILRIYNAANKTLEIATPTGEER